MKIKNNKIFLIIISVCIIFNNVIFATGYYPNYNPNYNPYYPNYYPYYPNYNPYYPNYNPYYNPYAIPYNCYYYISGYDRPVYSTSNWEPMTTRLPIINSNYPYYASIANGLVYNSYISISKWCNDNLYSDSIENYYLNYANIESSNPNQIILAVNCAIQKKGVISKNIEFKITLNISTNMFRWRKMAYYNGTSDFDLRVYEYNSETGELMIVG